MQVLIVHIHVKPECVEAFKAITELNCCGSLKEPGVARFEYSQQLDDPNRFIIYEAYRSLEAHAAHRETAHYKLWRDTVNPMMGETRFAVKYLSAYPPDSAW